MKKLLLLATLVLGVVSCVKDQSLEAGKGGEVDFTLAVELPSDVTRAAGQSSALGAIDNKIDLTKYDIRYVLCVYDAKGNVAKENIYNYSDETSTTFPLRLIAGRDYRFVVWADFVEANREDLHYNVSDLTNVQIVNNAEQIAMDESRDAYTGVAEIKKFNAASKVELTLTRPFAKLRVVTNDMDELYTEAQLKSGSVVYTQKVYTTFNALTATAGDATDVTRKIVYNDATSYTENAADEKTLFADYIFGAEDDKVYFTLNVEDATGLEIDPVVFNTNIPVKRNHLTTIYGPVLTDANNVSVKIDDNFAQPQPETVIEYKEASTAQELVNIFEEVAESTTDEEVHIVLTDDINLADLAASLFTRASNSVSVTIPEGKDVTLNIKDYVVTGVDNETASFGLFNIQPGAKLTIEGTTGKIQLTATQNRGWNAYSSVVSNQRGEFVLNGGTIEHLGGTDMAYGLDILTNTGAGDAKATINGGVVKSTYRAVRQFLNSTKATAELVVNGGTIDGRYNKSIWMQNANSKVNPGKLVVGKNANLYGDVMVSGAGAPELAIELSVAVEALKDNATVIPSNIPAGYALFVENGAYVIEKGYEVNGDEISICNAAGLKYVADKVNAGDTFEGKTVVLSADIDLNNENWTPIGYWTTFNGTFDGKNHTISNLKHHGTEEDCYVGLFGYTENATIKNLTINNVDLKLVANASWAGGHMGALVGNIEGETVIENIKVTGDVKIDGNKEMAGAGRIGGVVGGNVAKVSFKNVVVDANAGSFVQGNTSIGGIAGQIQQVTTFENCSANIDVTAQAFYAGGIVGLAYQNTSFTNCVTSGKVSVLAGREGNNNDLYRVGAIAGGWDDHENLTLVLEGCSTTCELFGASTDGRTATAFDCAGYVGRGYSAVVGAKVSVNGTVYEYAGEGVYKIGDSYVVNTGDALVAALAQKYNVTFGRDLKIDPANMSNAYGKTGVLVYNGQTIDGAGYKLDVKGAGGTWDSGICTSGGLIKDIWVTGSFRGVFVKGATHVEKVVLDNVRIEGTTYTISIDQASGQGLEATNSIFRGWTSYAATIGNVKFDGCTFGAGNGYNFSRPYAPTEYVNCDFEAGHQIDPRATVTFENCTFNGEPLTAENLATLVTSNIANAFVK